VAATRPVFTGEVVTGPVFTGEAFGDSAIPVMFPEKFVLKMPFKTKIFDP